MFDWLFGSQDASIPEWYIRERQLLAAQSGCLHQAMASRQEYTAKALELVKGCDNPMLNLQPYIDIVAQADALGLEVVRRTSHNTRPDIKGI